MNQTYLTSEGKQGRTIIARIKPGQEIIATLSKIIEQYNIQSGYIPTLFGGFRKVSLGSMKPSADPDHPLDIATEYSDPVDYHGTGTIAWQDGKPSLHIHLSIAGGNLQGTTGHLLRGEVVFVAEVVIVEVTGVSMKRKADPEIFGLSLLEFGDA